MIYKTTRWHARWPSYGLEPRACTQATLEAWGCVCRFDLQQSGREGGREGGGEARERGSIGQVRSGHMMEGDEGGGVGGGRGEGGRLRSHSCPKGPVIEIIAEGEFDPITHNLIASPASRIKATPGLCQLNVDHG